MIVTDDNPPKFGEPYTDSSTSASAALIPASNGLRPLEDPPPFEPNRPTTIDFSHEDTDWAEFGGEEPPEFTPYSAQFWLDSDGNVISHDPHLNEDGEALYRFLLSNTSEPPTFAIRCKGTHTETRTRSVTHAGHGSCGGAHHRGPHTKIETYTETVVDFDFKLDLTQYLLSPALWTVADDEPTYRGKMVWEKEVLDGVALNRRRTKRKENKQAVKWKQFQLLNGYPPWAQTGVVEALHSGIERGYTRSSRSFRDWADEYCASDKLLKEFVFEKVVHGWNLEQLKKSILALIKSTYYTGKIEITFPVSANKIYVRPTNQLSQALSHWWVKLLLWITLIYPFIWLFKRFSPNGGGVWRVAGAAYPMKEWIHLPDSVAGEDVAQYLTRKEEAMARGQTQRQLNALPSFPGDQKISVASSSSSGDAWADRRPQTLASAGATATGIGSATTTSSSVPKLSRLRQTPRVISELVGLREGEWFKEWEATITRAVLLRVNRKDLITTTGETVSRTAGAMLDGFED